MREGVPVSVSSVLLSALVVLVLAFLIFPLVVVIPESFSPSAVLQFPPVGLSLRWYQDFFNGPFWLDALRLSIELGVAVAVLSTAVGLLAAVALSRYVTLGRGLLRAVVLSPLIVPVIVTAIALFDVMIRLNLVGTFPGLVIAHTILALPFPVIVLENALRSVDPNLEDAAVSLGASRLRAFVQVTLRMITPSLLGAALFAFMASWDEVVIVLFVGGALMQTLPVKMFEFLTTEVRPTVASASTLLILALVVGLLAVQLRSYIPRSWKLRT
jgi:ABC-type spermidine/putrescine transport system permease subunit II